MSLLGKAAEWLARRKIDGARKGKEGLGMKKFLGFLDGYKRIVVLALFIVVSVLKTSGVGDYEGTLGFILRLLDFRPELSPVPLSVIAGTVAGIFAIIDGIKKALAERKAKQDDLISIRRFL